MRLLHRFPTVAVALVALVALALAGFSFALWSGSGMSVGLPGPVPTATFVPSILAAGTPEATTSHGYPPGIPAIQPRGPITPGLPAFSAQDMQDFLATYRPGYLAPGVPHPTIRTIAFLTAADLEAQLQTAIGRPPEALVCVVVLEGQFEVVTPPEFNGQGQRVSAAFSTLVFDASSGNLLLQGVHQEPPQLSSAQP